MSQFKKTPDTDLKSNYSFTIISQSLTSLPRRLVFRLHKLRKQNTPTHTLNPKSEIPSASVNLSHLYTMISSSDRYKCVRKTPNTERLHSKRRTRHHLAISHLCTSSSWKYFKNCVQKIHRKATSEHTLWDRARD
jgi:hypothetical protein